MNQDFPTTGNVTFGTLPDSGGVYPFPDTVPLPPYVSRSIATYPTPAPLPEARVELAETPPETIRWALGLLTPSELASALGVKEGTLSVWRSTGEGGPPYIKLGKHVFYRLEDLQQWVWTKYPQVKNTMQEAGADHAVQEELPLEVKEQNPSPWTPENSAQGFPEPPTTGL